MTCSTCLRTLSTALLITMFSAGACLPAGALTSDDIFASFQFNFITPGARATAMGGAFIGLADDATAAATNPAGLTVFERPEVSAELKYLGYTTEYPFDNPYYILDGPNYPQSPVRRIEFNDSVTALPFVSAVYPFKRFVVSLYRQELANYKSSYRTGPYYIAVPDTSYIWYPIDASVNLQVANYGLGAAFELFDGFSLAVSPRWSEFNMESHYAYFQVDDQRRYSTQFTNDQVVGEYKIDDSDEGFSLNAGLKWDLNEKLSLGAVYRSSTEFTVTATPGREGYQWLDPSNSERYDSDLAEFTMTIPKAFGAGVAFRPSDPVTLTFDVVHIRYEDMLKDFDIIFENDEVTSDSFTVDNVTEIHLGLEYVFIVEERVFSLRAGIYGNPDHTIKFNGKAGNYIDAQAYRSRFPGGDDHLHVTGGLGVVFNEHFQLDSAFDVTDNGQQVSVSAAYRF